MDEPCTSAPPRRPNAILLVLVGLALAQAAACIALVASGTFEVDVSHVGIASAILIASEAARRVVFCHARSAFLRRYTDLAPAQIALVDGSRRHEWLTCETERTARGLRVADVVFRKGGHVASIFFLFLVHQYVTEASLIVVLSLGTLLMVAAQASFVAFVGDGSSLSRVGCYLFGATDRIRDGRMARPNAMTASVALTWGMLAAYSTGFFFLRKPDVPLAGDLVVFPLTFGDALGEIVGTPFGRHTFRVRGLGDVNEKSVEGCVAVFLGSLVPTLLATAARPALPSAWGLAVIVSLTTTLVETISFRSTDNFTIPVSNAAAVLTWTRFRNLAR